MLPRCAPGIVKIIKFVHTPFISIISGQTGEICRGYDTTKHCGSESKEHTFIFVLNVQGFLSILAHRKIYRLKSKAGAKIQKYGIKGHKGL